MQPTKEYHSTRPDTGRIEAYPLPVGDAEPPAVPTSRNNSHAPSDGADWWRRERARLGRLDAMRDAYIGAFRLPRPYVNACGKGTLALHWDGGRVSFHAMTCGSWSCPSCRKRLAARLLDRIRRGLEARPGWQHHLVTLTVNPADFGAVRVGKAFWDENKNPWRGGDVENASRVTNLWSSPSRAQFAAVKDALSDEWNKLNKRLRAALRRAGLDGHEFFRVIELHRNGWPHIHVVVTHPADIEVQLRRAVDGWTLGRTDVRPIDTDGAVGEVAPYLVCSERKSGGSKAYQFAATSLPKHARLWTSSRGMLADMEEPEERPTHGVAVRGHFTSHLDSVRAFGGSGVLALNPPTAPDEEHRPPAAAVCAGDMAVVYFAELVNTAARSFVPAWAREMGEWWLEVQRERSMDALADEIMQQSLELSS